MKTFTTVLIVSLFIGLVAVAQKPDSVKVEYFEETIPNDQQREQERASAEENRLKEFFRNSHEERTLIKLGYTNGAHALFVTKKRPTEQQIFLAGIEFGVEQKVHPAWVLLGGFQYGWPSQRTVNDFKLKGHSFDAITGLAYYPAIMRNIRRGKRGNNFYRSAYLSLLAVSTIQDIAKATQINTQVEKSVNLKEYRHLLSFILGTHSQRTRFYYYDFSGGVGYLFGPDPGIRHNLQVVFRGSFGLGL